MWKNSFLHFTLGFITIVLASFFVIGIAARFSDEDIERESQIACQDADQC